MTELTTLSLTRKNAQPGGTFFILTGEIVMGSKNQPNETTEKAIIEGKKLASDQNSPRYSSMAELIKELEK